MDESAKPCNVVPDVYIDSIGLGKSTFGFNLVLYRSRPLDDQPTPGEPVAIVRMSADMAQGLVDLLRAGLAKQEADVDRSRVQEGRVGDA